MNGYGRRGFLRNAGVAVVAGLAGCLDDSGASNDGPRTVTPDDERVDWKVAFDAPVTVRPAVADDTVYVTAGKPGIAPDASDETGPLTALAADGRVKGVEPLSQPPAEHPRTHRGDCYLVTGGSNGMAGENQRLRRFSADGTEQWHTRAVDSFLHLLGFGDGRAYLGTSDDAIGLSGESLYGTSLADGTRTWEVASGDAVRGHYHDGQLLVEAGMRSLAAHDPADGSERWFFEGEPLSDNRQQLARAGVTAYVEPSETDGIASLDLGNGTTDWTVLPENVPTFVPTGAATDGDHLVATEYGGYVLGLDPADGTERWRFRTDADARDEPLLADGVAFVGDQGGSVYAVDAATGDERWSATVDGSVYWLRLDGDALVVATGSKERGELASFHAGDGAELWRYETSADLTRPVLGREHVFVVDEDDGAVLALGRERA